MYHEHRKKSAEAKDIDAIFEQGVVYMARPGLERTSRFRRAFDAAWETVHATAFDMITSSDPREQFIEVFDALWRMNDDPNSQRFLQFACMGYFMKNDASETHNLYYKHAQYIFEDKFTEDLTTICALGNITDGGKYPDPEQAARYAMTFMSTVILTWLMNPEGERTSSVSIASVRKSIKDLAYGGDSII